MRRLSISLAVVACAAGLSGCSDMATNGNGNLRNSNMNTNMSNFNAMPTMSPTPYSNINTVNTMNMNSNMNSNRGSNSNTNSSTNSNANTNRPVNRNGI